MKKYFVIFSMFLLCFSQMCLSKTFELNLDTRIPLNKPNISDQELIAWVKQVVILPYNFNYKNYAENWAGAQRMFTLHGWESFQVFLNQLGEPDKFELNKTAVSAVLPFGATVTIVRKDVVDGHFVWKVAVPIYISFQGRMITRRQQALAILTITRVDQSVSDTGIAIAQYATSVRAVT